jgi:predicted ester cyclase
MSVDNRAMAMRWFEEVWNRRCGEMIDEVLTEESVCFTDQGPVRGKDDFRQQMYLPLLQAFPDLHVQVEDIMTGGEDVVVRWTATGTHTGIGLPIAPTNKPASFSGISWIRVRDGKFHQGWQSSNIADVIRSLAEGASLA